MGQYSDMQDDREAVLKTIPHLRRYARIVTGLQETGDAWVERCIAHFMETPGNTTLETGGTLKFLLFRMLHQVGRDLTAADESTPAGGLKDMLRQALSRLPSLERQLLLLVVTEGFTPEEAGEILDIPQTRAQRMLSEARQELKHGTTVSILIIEDEPLIAMDLAQTVEDMGYRVSGTANRESKAVAAAEAAPPALILADIQLLDGDSGINAVRQILEKFDVPVVFVTGYPERLLSGHTPEPTYVVTKPFEPESLKLTIEQALSHHAARPDRSVH